MSIFDLLYCISYLSEYKTKLLLLNIFLSHSKPHHQMLLSHVIRWRQGRTGAGEGDLLPVGVRGTRPTEGPRQVVAAQLSRLVGDIFALLSYLQPGGLSPVCLSL